LNAVRRRTHGGIPRYGVAQYSQLKSLAEGFAFLKCSIGEAFSGLAAPPEQALAIRRPALELGIEAGGCRPAIKLIES
jgi:hypothetical protein